MLMRVLLIVLLCAALPLQAGVQVRGTRIIYDEAHGETIAHLRYLGEGARLLQVWLVDAISGDERPPFIVTPPVSRIEPGGEQIVRILRTREGLPQDRESLFYFNVIEVPPEPTDFIIRNEPFLQISMHSQFKLFYRPRGLRVPADKAIELLRFSTAPPAPDGRLQLRVLNPSPYYVTFAEVRLHQGRSGEPVMQLAADVTPGERMVAPMGELLLRLDGEASRLPYETEVEVVIINDVGGRPSRRQKVGA